MTTKLRYAMVGGGPAPSSARCTARRWRWTAQFELVAGALSSSPEKARASGPRPGPGPTTATTPTGRRCWRTSCSARRTSGSTSCRSSRPTTCTSRWRKAFAEAGFHVVCDKPLVHTSAQAARTGRGGARAAAPSSASPTTTPATRWCGRPARWCEPANSARSARSSWNTTRAGSPRGWKQTRQQAGRLAHRSGAQRRRRRHRRHRLARREPGGHGHRAGAGKPLRRPDHLRAGRAAGRRRQRAAALHQRRARRADRLADRRRAARTTCACASSARSGTLDWRQEEPNQLAALPASTGPAAC